MSLFSHRRWLAAGAMALALVASSFNQSQAGIFTYGANLNGASEAPSNASPAVGTATVTIDTVLNTMRVQATFSGLQGNSTAAHIHAATAVPLTGTAGVATTTPSFAGLTLGSPSGSMDQTYDMSLAGSYNAAYITANGGTPLSAFLALSAAIDQGRAYYNVHSSAFAGGEIRGFLVAVPEPSSMALLGTFVAGAGWRAWRRRRANKA